MLKLGFICDQPSALSPGAGCRALPRRPQQPFSTRVLAPTFSAGAEALALSQHGFCQQHRDKPTAAFTGNLPQMLSPLSAGRGEQSFWIQAPELC